LPGRLAGASAVAAAGRAPGGGRIRRAGLNLSDLQRGWQWRQRASGSFFQKRVCLETRLIPSLLLPWGTAVINLQASAVPSAECRSTRQQKQQVGDTRGLPMPRCTSNASLSHF
jgi:hypothetical protein